MSQRSGTWLLREPSAHADARLFVMPYSGVGASVFRHWPERFGPVEVCPVQPPGRENRLGHAPYETFEEFGADCARALLPYTDRPYAVFGHCMGALLAHALVTALAAERAPAPRRLFVSSSRVPHWPPERRYRMPAPGATGVYHPSMTDDQLREQVQRVSRLLGQGELHPDLVPMALRVLRADLRMCFGYRPAAAEPVNCPVTAISWEDDSDVRPEEMTYWSACGPLSSHTLPGGKWTVLDATAPLADVIERDFGRPQEADVQRRMTV
ncbi:thioesterase II family protein [Streptomyces cinerochromogenes]|uniref:Thioesterase II family protein n=1 Tax=Streptomyces cinerochromogenes TaxID=66422 RepID=A0ABW7BAF0_9ACTN